MAEDWTKEWERRIVNGVYPLRRFLGRSNHSVVFLTECTAQAVASAAIKILPANPALMEAQLEHWHRVAALSHPHLIRLLDAGRCQLGGHNFLFVVTEYAEQTLAQILPSRALTADEVQELLPATLETLAYLHGKNLVHGGLKPPNFLVVDDQLKLASDTIRPAGECSASTAKPSVYDPPEAKDGRASLAGDLWGLGIMLVEALTQTPPAWSRERSEPIALPADLAPQFVATVQRCLNRDPGQRPAIADLVAQFNPPLSLPPQAQPQPPQQPMPAPAAPPPPPPRPSVAPPVMDEPLIGTPSPRRARTRGVVVVAIAGSILALWAVWMALARFHTHATVEPTASATPRSPSVSPPTVSPSTVMSPSSSPPPVSPPTVSPPTVSSPAATEPPTLAATASPSTVIHQEMPDVSRRARASIRGIIRIVVRVSVDRGGRVVTAALENRASSNYFDRAAVDAAKQWRFSEAADPASRVWRLHFEFARTGTHAHAAAAQ